MIKKFEEKVDIFTNILYDINIKTMPYKRRRQEGVWGYAKKSNNDDDNNINNIRF